MMQDLINYMLLADKIYIDAFEHAGKPLPEAERLLSHVLNAQHIWISRIHKESPIYERMQVHPVESFGAIHLTNSEKLLDIVQKEDLNQPLIYSNSQGEEFVNIVHDVLFHIVNHSTYHRGQVALEFRRNDVNPPVTDYIFLKRLGEL